MNEQSGNSGQLQGDVGSGGDAPIDVTDPWRGLYRAESLIANGDGDLYHPDLPSWPDDREDALDKLVHAQGFDFQIVAGEFSDEATEDGGELYWEEMRAWNPEAPEGEWRLAWKGDTEDGPYAWFVRPMALRPYPEALTARQPAGQKPFELRICEVKHTVLKPNRAYIFTVDVNCEACRSRAAYAVGEAPAPAAVPVDGEGWSGWATQYPGKMPVLHGAREIAELNYYPEEGQRLLYLATHPQPAAAKDVPELFVQWLEREMPAGTIIGKPAWWAPKLARALRSAERGVLGGCNG
ncbi:hypothetical protein [Xanthomonas prunicola]|uniref:Uncharacterized protein n=1 Tax=Xanthomonas prunicola TaxID=2053930 RepID=A0A9Q9IYW1_9XANT|nr:hypothetical protein [Xanthomonas prunicola]UXA66062.1 hypothetical protein M0D43_03175 [Xanthomonas prunicola]